MRTFFRSFAECIACLMSKNIDKKLSFNRSDFHCGRASTNSSSKMSHELIKFVIFAQISIVCLKKSKKKTSLTCSSLNEFDQFSVQKDPKNVVCIRAVFCLSKHILQVNHPDSGWLATYPTLHNAAIQFNVSLTAEQYCCQKFGLRCEEMLRKPSQSEVSVLYAFGTEIMCGWN